jgi:hypothetical protein
VEMLERKAKNTNIRLSGVARQQKAQQLIQGCVVIIYKNDICASQQ